MNIEYLLEDTMISIVHVSYLVVHRLDITAKSLVPMYNVVKRKEMFL